MSFVKIQKKAIFAMIKQKAMKKLFLLLTAVGAILFAGCRKDDKSQDPLPFAIDATCTCGATYHLEYHMQVPKEESLNAEATPSFKEYPSGQSPMWTLTFNGEGYPLTTYKEGDINEGYCKWSCSCGKSFTVLEKDCLASDWVYVAGKIPVKPVEPKDSVIWPY